MKPGQLKGTSMGTIPSTSSTSLRYMLLLPSSGLPSINALTPPEWAGIQEMLHERALAALNNLPRHGGPEECGGLWVNLIPLRCWVCGKPPSIDDLKPPYDTR